MRGLTFGLFAQFSNSGPHGPLVYVMGKELTGELSCIQIGLDALESFSCIILMAHSTLSKLSQELKNSPLIPTIIQTTRKR